MEFWKSWTTGWSVVRIYRIPENLRFTVSWTYETGWPFDYQLHTVKQRATYARVVLHNDGSFFSFDVLDEDEVTIRGKHCRGVDKYIEIYNRVEK